jgi:acylphosphatase
MITGRVQGVWFRGWTVDEARMWGLDGWVRNRRDGSVEVLIAGPPDAVDAMIAACRVGPPDARVIEVVVEPAEDPGSTGFSQAPTH